MNARCRSLSLPVGRVTSYLIQRSRGPGPVTLGQPPLGTGGNPWTDEEVAMPDRPTKPVFSRPPDDEAGLDAWAESFVNALLGDLTPQADED